MSDRWKVYVRYTLIGAVYAFAFPCGFMLIFTSREMGVLPAFLAGAISAVTAGPTITFLFVVLVPYTRRFPFLPAILIQVAAFMCVGTALIVFNIASVIAIFANRPIMDKAVVERTIEVINLPILRSSFYLSFSLFFLITMVHQISRKIGPGVFWSWMTGKYHRPKEEEWVFMFLDLKDSTPLAERLGSLEFSALLQQFFSDLGWAVYATKATVSHYIGDEAVIVWRPERAFKNANCLRLFFRMQQEIKKRAAFYQARFGVVPTFKAGVHIGPVVAAEVGRAKSEIVYHGDAVNTTARIVGMCASLGRDLLVSKEIAARLADTALSFESLGAHELKGKSEPVEIYGVTSEAT
jgi:adenylate cyclase